MMTTASPTDTKMWHSHAVELLLKLSDLMISKYVQKPNHYISNLDAGAHTYGGGYMGYI